MDRARGGECSTFIVSLDQAESLYHSIIHISKSDHIVFPISVSTTKLKKRITNCFGFIFFQFLILRSFGKWTKHCLDLRQGVRPGGLLKIFVWFGFLRDSSRLPKKGTPLCFSDKVIGWHWDQKIWPRIKLVTFVIRKCSRCMNCSQAWGGFVFVTWLNVSWSIDHCIFMV